MRASAAFHRSADTATDARLNIHLDFYQLTHVVPVHITLARCNWLYNEHCRHVFIVMALWMLVFSVLKS